MKFLVAAFAFLCINLAAAKIPDTAGMYGWQLRMDVMRLGEGYIGAPVTLKCGLFRLGNPRDCMDNGMFLKEAGCLAASREKGEVTKQFRKYMKVLIEDIYSKPPAGPNDYYADVLHCVHVVGPSVQS